MSDINVLNFLYNRGYSDMNDLTQLLLRYKYENIDPTPIYSLICYTRSIQYGKGERDMSYRLIVALFSVFPSLGLDVLRHVILIAGGMNDVKRFCLIYQDDPDCEPLVALAISLANTDLRTTGNGKWIPRERGHKELYDRFVRDWFGCSFITNGMRKEYRYILSETALVRGMYTSGSRTVFIGEYFKAGLKALSCPAANASWSSLLRIIGNCCSGCVPIVDIDIEIKNENLYHALGFACLIAQKSKSWRVLLISYEPIWVDLTAACGDFCAMVALLWDHCDIKSRSRMSLGLELIHSVPVGSSTGIPLRLVFFSETFDFDWNLWVPRFHCPVIFWNIGSRATIPVDFYLDDHIGLSLMSGYMPGLVSSIGSS